MKADKGTPSEDTSKVLVRPQLRSIAAQTNADLRWRNSGLGRVELPPEGTPKNPCGAMLWLS